MKKKFHWCKLSDTDVDSASNQIKVEGEKANKNIEVKVVDENNNEVKRYQDVRVDKHKVLIIMNFQ
jgi:hypothetical protein